MQPVWLCFYLCTKSADTHENTQWRKCKVCNLASYHIWQIDHSLMGIKIILVWNFTPRLEAGALILGTLGTLSLEENPELSLLGSDENIRWSKVQERRSAFPNSNQCTTNQCPICKSTFWQCNCDGAHWESWPLLWTLLSADLDKEKQYVEYENI